LSSFIHHGEQNQQGYGLLPFLEAKLMECSLHIPGPFWSASSLIQLRSEKHFLGTSSIQIKTHQDTLTNSSLALPLTFSKDNSGRKS
jgi:pyoverdine/dityrosine biosynthesis protein Dit1